MMLTRRNVLAGLLAGATCSVAGRDLRAGGGAPPAAPKRLVLVMTPNGTQQASFWPRTAFNSPILSPILGVPALARRTTVVRGVFYPRDLGGAEGNEHDVGFARMFTGAPILAVGGAPWGGAASVDQVLGKRWNVDPLNLAVLTSSIEPFPKAGFNHRVSFSYVAPGVLRMPFVDPFDAYAASFGLDAASLDEPARRRLLVRSRVLETPRRELEEMRGRLRGVEQLKLDAHTNAVVELERRLGRLASGRAVVCGARPATPKHYQQVAPEALVTDERAVPELTSAMVDLIAASFACDVTRIATLQLGYAGAKWMFDWEKIGRDAHQDLAHRDHEDEGSDPEITRLLVRVHRWYATQVAALAQRLDAIPEGAGTVLDNTLIVWSSELGRGDHDLKNVPLVLLGGAGGALGEGRFIDAAPQSFQRVGCTILRAMGEVAAGFGDAPTCGPLEGVLA
ncbi:hypothetical protein BH11MYX4_BH11MYX4_18030 [soil metagenome]